MRRGGGEEGKRRGECPARHHARGEKSFAPRGKDPVLPGTLWGSTSFAPREMFCPWAMGPKTENRLLGRFGF